MSLRLFISAAAGALALASGVYAQPAPASAPAYGDLHWRQLGPFRGGWATMVEGVAEQPDTFYFAAAGGGLWRTTRRRTDLETRCSNTVPAASVGALWRSRRRTHDVIYIGTGQPEPRYDVAAGLGVYRSSDGGAHLDRSWAARHQATSARSGSIRTIRTRCWSAAQGHFFGPSPDRGVYRSTDGGRTWSARAEARRLDRRGGYRRRPAATRGCCSPPPGRRTSTPGRVISPRSSGPGSTVYKSLDGGVSWTRRCRAAAGPAEALGRIGLAVTHTGVRG